MYERVLKFGFGEYLSGNVFIFCSCVVLDAIGWV